jgi:hypothetical protein
MKTSRFILNFWILAGFVFGIAACTEPYDIRLDEGFNRIVVDGSISTDSVFHSVRLTKSTSYFFDQAPPPVEQAIVYLLTDNGRILLVETAETPGLYQVPFPVKGIPGMEYKLEINLKQEIGGRDRYEAVTRMPTTAFVMDSIALDYQSSFDFFLVKLYAFDPPSADFYKFDALINGRMITDTARRSLVVDDRFFNGNNTSGLSVMFIRGDELAQGDTLTLVMSALSRDYYDFFNELRTEAGSSNPLFSGPPANIRSNVMEGGLGYFDARIVQRTSIILQNDPKQKP